MKLKTQNETQLILVLKLNSFQFQLLRIEPRPLTYFWVVLYMKMLMHDILLSIMVTTFQDFVGNVVEFDTV